MSATINLGNIFSTNNLQARLYRGDPWSGKTPGTLNPDDLLQRWSTAVSAGSGTGSLQVIDPIQLQAGHYVLEVRGRSPATARRQGHERHQAHPGRVVMESRPGSSSNRVGAIGRKYAGVMALDGVAENEAAAIMWSRPARQRHGVGTRHSGRRRRLTFERSTAHAQRSNV